MSRRRHLNSRETAELVGLVAEAMSSFADPRQQLEHILTGLNKAVGAKYSLLGNFHGLLPGQAMRFADGVGAGVLSAAEASAVGYYFAETTIESDPALRVYRHQVEELAREGVRVSHRQRSDLVTHRRWYTDQHVLDVRKTAAIDHCVYGSVWTNEPGKILSVSAHRAWGEPAFTTLEFAKVSAVHLGVLEIMVRAFAPRGPERRFELARAGLTPRLRSVLERLLSADSEKQAAAKLGLQTPAFHAAVVRLYHRLGVSSRAELMALFIDERLVPGARTKRRIDA
jgi:DNA-binding CsgD family transcriptional regulator